MKRSKEERLANERAAREAREFVTGSKEIYKNRFKNQNRKIHDIHDAEELEDFASAFN